MKFKLFFLVLAVAALALSTLACGTVNINVEIVRGSGDIVTESYDVDGFNRVSLSGAGRLEVIQDGTESATVQTDDNILEYLVVEVRGNTLYVEYDTDAGVSVDPTLMVVTLHVRDLERVEASGAWEVRAEELTADTFRLDISGAGSARIDELTAESIDVNLSGAGEVEIGGEVTSQEIEISGVGRYDAGDLRSETARINVSGTGNAIVWATETLTIDVSGAGRVDYYGDPQVTIHESGAADVNSLGDK